MTYIEKGKLETKSMFNANLSGIMGRGVQANKSGQSNPKAKLIFPLS